MHVCKQNHGPHPRLFEPISIGDLRLPNRLVMAPMGTRLCSEDGNITEAQMAYYEARAAGGVGLIISESTAVDPLGLTGATSMRLFDNAQIGAHNELVERIKAKGGRIISQLVHAGRQTKRENLRGQQPVAPSPLACAVVKVMPRELTTGEVEELVTKFAAAALRAKTAGYDGVELHGAHGYLIDGFMSARTNQRTDKYGGSFENCMRFPLEIMAAVRKAVGPDYPVLFRLSAVNTPGNQEELDETLARARLLEEAGVDALDISAGSYEALSAVIEPMPFAEAWKIGLAAAVKAEVNVPVIGVGVIRSPAVAEDILAQGQADMVALGRALLADPLWPEKARQGREAEINRCISCNIGCMGGRILRDLRVRCTVNPVTGREYLQAAVGQATVKKYVLVIGGGPGGITAALAAAKRGHRVTLVEASPRLGGQLSLAAKAPGKDKILWFLDHLVGEVKRQGLDVRLETSYTAEDVLAQGPDAVVLAAGARQGAPAIPGVGGDHVLPAWQVLTGESPVGGQKVVVAGGGTVGAETALMLAQEGKEVSVVEMLPDLALDMEPINRINLLGEMRAAGIQFVTNTKIESIGQGSVTLRDLADGQTRDLPADAVVTALGSVANNELQAGLEGKVEELYVVGDCAGPRKIINAMEEGHQVGCLL